MEDLARMEEIYAYARERMRESGNPHQWGEDRPSHETVVRDIRDSISYVIEKNGEICGVFVFFVGEDPDYRNIEEGSWKNELPYGVIHRVAGDGREKGILAQAVAYCSRVIPNLRIDTHHDNKIMQQALQKNGFEPCGIVYIEGRLRRIAYQRTEDGCASPSVE